MKNLFVMHTQYNLILATGLAKKRYNSDTNILVVYAEFNLGDELKNNLEKCFDKVYYIQEKFQYTLNVLKNDIRLYRYLKKSKAIYKDSYDNVFISQENPYETYLLSKISKHCCFNCYAVEEDVYYSVNNKLNENPPNKIPKSFLGRTRELVLRLFLGKNDFERFVYFYGQSDIFDSNYVLFPNQVRHELKAHNLSEITLEEVGAGIENLYSHIASIVPQNEKVLLCFFDLIERYKNKSVIVDLMKQVVDICQKNEITFVYKYHPRENEKFEFPDSDFFVEIPAAIPAEKLLHDYKRKKVNVIGNLTTALWVAAKYQYKVMSIVKIENKENLVAVKALQGMNIETLTSIDEFRKVVLS